MKIEIDDATLSKFVHEEYNNIKNRRDFRGSNLEIAVGNAVRSIVQTHIVEMIKKDASLMDRLIRDLSTQLEIQLGKLGVKIANAISENIKNAMESEFQTYNGRIDD